MLKLKRIENALLFLTILFLPTQLGRHFWPEFSFIYSLPIDYLSPTLYFWDILVVLLCTLFLLQNKHINRLAINLFYFFILTQSLSLLSPVSDKAVGFVRLEQYFTAGIFGVYLASSKFKVRSSKLYWPLFLAVVLESVLAVAQFMHGGTLGFWIFGERTFTISTPGIAKFDFQGIQFLRPYGTFPHPNVLAGFMIVAAVLLKAKIAVLLAGLVILLTVARTVILAGFFAALMLLNKKWKIMFLAGAIVLSPVLYTRFSAIFNFDSLSLIRREELSEIAIKMWASSPFLGVGLNNFILKSAEQVLVGPSRFLQPVHNIFLLALTETGVVGLAGLLILIGYPIWKGYRLQVTGYSIIWAIIIFLGLFDHYFLTLPQGYRLLFLIWGLSFSMLESKA